MLHHPRIPEINQRDRFVKAATASRLVYAVAGDDGLGRVPSQRHRGREVTLLWTSRRTAERWADVIAEEPRVEEIRLDRLIGEVLPAMSRLARLVGPDWGSDSIEPELDAAELSERLHRELHEGFAERVRGSRKVYLLEDSAGPALVVSTQRSDQLVLPCWSERAHAESRIEGPWSGMTVVEVPISSFIGRTLQWLDGRGWAIGPDHVMGPGAVEMTPAELRAALSLNGRHLRTA